MLKELVEKKHYRFVEGAKDWREAIRMSCEVLESDGTVEENSQRRYSQMCRKVRVVHCAYAGTCYATLPRGAQGVHKTEIAFMRLEHPCEFRAR